VSAGIRPGPLLLPTVWGALLLHVVLHPVWESVGPGWERYCLGVVDTFLIASLAMLSSRMGIHGTLALWLALGVLILSWTGILLAEPLWITVGSLSRVLLYLLSTGLILVWVLSAGRFVGDVIHGVTCVYLLLGMSWASVYRLLDLFLPNAFHGIQTGSDYMYFSLATLTTLGYGDIVPAHPVVRALAGLEAASGVLFATVFVASIVGSVRGSESAH
jgi:voltage-gated potassium channel